MANPCFRWLVLKSYRNVCARVSYRRPFHDKTAYARLEINVQKGEAEMSKEPVCLTKVPIFVFLLHMR